MDDKGVNDEGEGERRGRGELMDDKGTGKTGNFQKGKAKHDKARYQSRRSLCRSGGGGEKEKEQKELGEKDKEQKELGEEWKKRR